MEQDFTILGIEIGNKLNLPNIFFENIYNKTRSIISCWSGYDLSIQGKTTVRKTLLISQYTYIGSILDCITSEQMILIQSQIDYFINHGKNKPKEDIAKKKALWIDSETLCNDKKLGGFGCINIKDFFSGLKLSRIRRYALNKINDHWCDIIYTLCGIDDINGRKKI